jgi:inner membrane protein
MSAAGLGRRSALATVTLIIGANLPDIDVVATLWGPVASLVVRRGWTHGVLALVVLPLILTAVIVGWDRIVRSRSASDGPPVLPRQILLLAFLSVASHPVLDFLNTYGMRWLMPFQDRWYYGDTLFIVDLWVWGLLASGLWLTRRARRLGRDGAEAGTAARVALVILACYILLMGAGTAIGRGLVGRDLSGMPGSARVMVAPVPLNPFVRSVVISRADTIRFGEVHLGPRPTLRWLPASQAQNRLAVEETGVLVVKDAAAFLHWARFPFFQVERREDSTVVYIVDARYTTEREARFGALRVAVPRDSLHGIQIKAP